MEIFLWILFYMVSVVIGYFGIRKLLLDLEEDPSLMLVFIMLTPIVNITLAAFVWGEYISRTKKTNKILRKFFKI